VGAGSAERDDAWVFACGAVQSFAAPWALHEGGRRRGQERSDGMVAGDSVGADISDPDTSDRASSRTAARAPLGAVGTGGQRFMGGSGVWGSSLAGSRVSRRGHGGGALFYCFFRSVDCAS